MYFLFYHICVGSDEITGRRKHSVSEAAQVATEVLATGTCVSGVWQTLTLFGWKVPHLSGNAGIVSDTRHVMMKHGLL